MLSNPGLKFIRFLLLSVNYSTYLFRQRLCSRLTALWRFINFVLLLLLLYIYCLCFACSLMQTFVVYKHKPIIWHACSGSLSFWVLRQFAVASCYTHATWKTRFRSCWSKFVEQSAERCTNVWQNIQELLSRPTCFRFSYSYWHWQTTDICGKDMFECR